MKREDGFPNAHPIIDYIEVSWLWKLLLESTKLKISKSQLKCYLYGIDPMPEGLKPEIDEFYRIFGPQDSSVMEQDNEPLVNDKGE